MIFVTVISLLIISTKGTIRNVSKDMHKNNNNKICKGIHCSFVTVKSKRKGYRISELNLRGWIEINQAYWAGSRKRRCSSYGEQRVPRYRDVAESGALRNCKKLGITRVKDILLMGPGGEVGGGGMAGKEEKVRGRTKFNSCFKNHNNFTLWVKNTFFKLACIHKEMRNLTPVCGKFKPREVGNYP